MADTRKTNLNEALFKGRTASDLYQIFTAARAGIF